MKYLVRYFIFKLAVFTSNGSIEYYGEAVSDNHLFNLYVY